MNGAHGCVGRGCWCQGKGVDVMLLGEIILPPSSLGLEQSQLPPQLFPHPLPFDWKDFPMGKWRVAKRELEMV